MLIRRAFLWWLVAAAVVLPIWLGVGWVTFGRGGWGTLGLVITVPITFITLAVVALLVRIRPTVRADRAASWMDVGVVGALHAAVIGIGFYGDSGAFFGVMAILLAIVAFWSSVWQLISDGAKRMEATMVEFERLAAEQTGQGSGDTASRPFTRVDEEIIVIQERTERTERTDGGGERTDSGQ
ncbi:hypothetical protein [Agromyces bauzanensis]|nr:hypothetical protein [Agromyces bauzanensis]